MPSSVNFTRQVPVAGRYVVLVVGGGVAGVPAAIAAARSGARTALVERYGFLGGTATAAGVGPFMSSYSIDGATQIVRGIFEECMQRMEAIGGAVHPSKVRRETGYSGYWKFAHDNLGPFDAEALKLVAAEMCLEAGVDLYLHTMFLEPILHEDAVAGAIIAGKPGLQAIEAKVTVDCSGDADVVYRAGAPTEKGRPEDGKTMPMTFFFRIGNLDARALEAYQRDHPEERLPFQGIVEAARARGEFNIAKEMFDVYLEPGGWSWRVNMTKVLGRDGTDTRDLALAEIEGRRQMYYLLEFIRHNLPGAAECVLVGGAAQIGVRETRRIVGEYVLTGEDITSGKLFHDAVAFGSFPIDVPKVDGIGGSFTAAAAGREGGYQVPNYHSIPYRSLVPLKIEQLLVAGRCLSATREAIGAVRVMTPCFAMGQAAGTAAALAAELHVHPRDLDTTLLRRRLAEQDCYLGPDTSGERGQLD
jgi:hypothetical protein